jgi:hypothetical protein
MLLDFIGSQLQSVAKFVLFKWICAFKFSNRINKTKLILININIFPNLFFLFKKI